MPISDSDLDARLLYKTGGGWARGVITAISVLCLQDATLTSEPRGKCSVMNWDFDCYDTRTLCLSPHTLYP